MRQYCGSIDECVFGVDGICVYCERKEPKRVVRDDDEEVPELDPVDSLLN